MAHIECFKWYVIAEYETQQNDSWLLGLTDLLYQVN